MKVAGKREGNRTDGKTLLLVVIIFVAVIFAGVFTFLRFYNSYIDGILYRERLHQMKEVTSELFNGIEDVVQNQWDNTDIFCNYLELGRPKDVDSLLIFMKKQAKLNNMDVENANLIAIDEKGRYLTQNGWQGTLDEMDLLMDNPEKLSFVSKSMTSDTTYMYFVKCLEKPVVMQDGEQEVKLSYYGVAKDMEQLNPYFTCEAYDNSNSVYVLNQYGSRFFRSNSSNQLRGYNVFKTLEEMDYLHDNSFEEARKDLDSTGYGYSNAILDGKEYYYALYQMEHAEWTLLFLVPSSYVAADVVSMVNTTVKLILIFAIALICVASFMIYFLLRVKQNQALEIERRSNEQLDAKNAELTKALQIAEEATTAKTNFLANMSHDIRTPMNAIVGITNLMAHEKDDPEKLDAYIHKVQSSSRHLLSLINDVLDMSKIESSDITLNIEPVNLAEQINQVDSIIRPQVDERQQSFVIRVHEIVHESLIGDAVRLRQIFINLLSNAVKYTPYGGEIFLDITEMACDEKGRARFSIAVTDNGYGMAPEFVEKIFEPFTRAENSVTNKVQGTGLGMAITKSIVDLMNGTIAVQSEPGKGSRFEVTLSLAIDEEAKCELPVKRVLLITEEDALIRNVEAGLKGSGVSLDIVRDEQKAVAWLKTEPVDAVLIGGYLYSPTLMETIKALRSAAKNVPFIFCCDYANAEKIRDILVYSGIDGLVSRPFFLSNFARVLNQAADKAVDTVADDTSVLKGMKFLCAEDNDLNAEILKAILDMEEATCTIYSNGKNIVDAFADVKPGDYDAILMDVQMPVMNGLDATRAIRTGKNPLGQNIPIIAMTANAFSSDIQACLDAGMDAHVAKPLDIAVLARTLKSLQNAKYFGGGTKTCSGDDR